MAHSSSSAHTATTRSGSRTALYVLGALGSLGATVGIGIWLWKRKTAPTAAPPAQPVSPPPPQVQPQQPAAPPAAPQPAPAPAAPPATSPGTSGLVQTIVGLASGILSNPNSTSTSPTTPPPPPPPSGVVTASVTAPAAGAALSGPVTLSATASTTYAGDTISSVAFYDGTTLLATATSAPYQVSWDTTQGAGGSHSLSATATDSGGHTGSSAAVPVTVNNAPAAPVNPANPGETFVAGNPHNQTLPWNIGALINEPGNPAVYRVSDVNGDVKGTPIMLRALNPGSGAQYFGGPTWYLKVLTQPQGAIDPYLQQVGPNI